MCQFTFSWIHFSEALNIKGYLPIMNNMILKYDKKVKNTISEKDRKHKLKIYIPCKDLLVCLLSDVSLSAKTMPDWLAIQYQSKVWTLVLYALPKVFTCLAVTHELE